MLIQAKLPPGLASDVENFLDLAAPEGGKAGLVRQALREFLRRHAADGGPLLMEDGGDFSTPDGAPTQNSPATNSTLRESFEDVVDFLPTIPVIDEGVNLRVTLSKSTVRALDVLRQTPGVKQEIRSDLLRTAIHYFLLAVANMQSISHPTWMSCIALARRAEGFARQVAVADDLHAAAVLLRDTLAPLLEREDVPGALDEWISYYHDATLQPEVRREAMFRVLSDLPAAQWVAWKARESGQIPGDMIPLHEPILGPWSPEGIPPAFADDEGSKRLKEHYYQKGYRAGRHP